MAFFTLETAQAQLSPGGNFGPWIWDLKLRVEHVSPDELRIRLPFDDRIARPGGVVIGQAMMAMVDTVMVLAICEKLGRFATLATISQTTNFLRAAVRRDVIGVARAVKVGRSTDLARSRCLLTARRSRSHSRSRPLPCSRTRQGPSTGPTATPARYSSASRLRWGSYFESTSLR
ncbi:PaaI family thioesterase [Reyranella sp.]|uniref:PaaI family thioesterase n=1 Tax=Reyranella sp. TaxID=1929291 RepID=UPI003D13A21C